MEQDASWSGGRTRFTRDIVLDGDTASAPLNGHSPSPNFRPMPVVAKRLDGLRCHVVLRLRPRRLYVRWGPSCPQKQGHTHPTQFLAHFYCGQTAGWIKVPLGTEVNLGPGDVVLDDPVARSPKGGGAVTQIFGPCLL